jgi:membrane protein DedA with SNARE-associated domain
MDEREPRRIPLPWLLSVFVASMVVGFVGDIAGPRLITSHPLLQIALNPRNRWLLLATPQIGAVPFYIVGFLRLVSTDPIGYVLGYQYGDRAVSWAEKQMGDTSGVIKMVQRGFGRVAPLVILIMPSFYWCVLAGAARMRVRTFVILNIIGTIGRLILFRLAGHAFRDQLQDVLSFVQRYQWWLVGVSFIVVAITVWRSGGIDTPDELAEEIEHAGPAEEGAVRDE